MDTMEITDTELKKAFTKKPKMPGKKKVGITALVIGVVCLLAGAGFLLWHILSGPNVRDAEFLVSVGAWQREDEPTVVWNFSEIGKGTLTTNFHINDYDFIWRIDGNTLKIETAWLYVLNNDYTYRIDQGNKVLTLTVGEESWNFVPVEHLDNAEDEEVPTE